MLIQKQFLFRIHCVLKHTIIYRKTYTNNIIITQNFIFCKKLIKTHNTAE